jgi:signal-transduction protein with cAMP-binding, CBS, and nucleotidyltransferase domain
VPDVLATTNAIDAAAAVEPVGALVRARTVTVEQHDSLRDVARELVAGEADAALVVSPLGEVGIVTARDVVTVVAAGGAVDGEQVRGAMSVDLVVVDADEPISVVGRKMLAAGVRHVVVREDARVVGLVFLDDVLDALLA